MYRIIGVTELQRNFRRVLDEVVHKRAAYILTRGSRPEAVLVPYAQYLKYEQADAAGVLKRFDEVLKQMESANARFSDAEVETDLKDASRAVRRHRRK